MYLCCQRNRWAPPSTFDFKLVLSDSNQGFGCTPGVAPIPGRSAIGRVLISLIFSPVVAIMALLVPGVPYRPDDRDI